MLNEFKLSPLEKKNILQDAKSLTNQGSYEIRYYEDEGGGYNPGISESTSSNWSTYEYYPSVIQEIDEFSKKRYDYGDMTEGDIILLLPYDTSLPKDSNKYQFKYNEIDFTAEILQKEHLLDKTVVYYYLVGKR